jgi:hypothetical protein|tara:strand:- start:179 stop:445 length:267 start_codon:yes stop_codon:yes gene_type:complete
MKIKTSHGEFNIREMKFPDRRKLHRMEIQTVATDGDVNQEKFFDILEWVREYAFKDSEKELGHLDDNDVDEVLSDVYQHYKGPSKKKT